MGLRESLVEREKEIVNQQTNLLEGENKKRGNVKTKKGIHCGTKPGRFETTNHSLSYELGS